jgi:hypothetical protein
LLSLLYLDWLNPFAVSALLLTWSLTAHGSRMEWKGVGNVLVEAAVRTMPSLLILGLSIALSAIWQHRLVLPAVVVDGSLTVGIGQGMVWLFGAAVAVITAAMLRHGLAAMALLAPPAVLLAQTIDLSLLLQGPGLAAAIALGTRIGINRADRRGSCPGGMSR